MSKLLHRFSLGLAFATAFLIFAGGMVTTTQSGLAVPDWPLSYGRLMPPMIGGIFYEHGHRMIATAVGFLTVTFAFLAMWKEDRTWVRRAAWVAVGLVIVQGLLGGLTVLLRLPKPISIAHACAAQTFFSLVLCLTVWTSSFWRSTPTVRTEPMNAIPLHRMAIALFGVTYAQLVIGATLRHTGMALPFHIGGAVMVAALTIWVLKRVLRDHRSFLLLKRLAIAVTSALVLQILLGIATFFLLIHRFDVIPPPLAAQMTITSHVVVGALVLGLSLMIVLVSYRTRPSHTPALQTTLSDFVTLTKPGISLMAGITALAGFVLGSGEQVNMVRLLHTCIGTLMTAAGAGSLNMLIERDIDSQMNRTKKRPLPSGRLYSGEVLFMGTFLSALGVAYLTWSVNILTAVLSALTIGIYLYIYTPLKKISVVCVLVGAVSGALPPVMGWTAARGTLGWEPLVLFGILFFWQFPHFLSLAWLYREDYRSGGLQMIQQDDRAAAKSILVSSIALLIVSLLPTAMNLTGWIYGFIAFATSLVMATMSFRFFKTHSALEARRVFLFSLIYIPILVIFMILNRPAVL